MKQQRAVNRSLFFILLILITLAASTVIIYYQVRTDPVTEAVKGEEPAAFLFMVHDDEALLFTEIFYYHPVTRKGALLDIPGETGLIIESLGRVDRIDTLYHVGRVDEYVKKIEELTGFEIAFYFDFHLENIERSIDLIDGIDIFLANSVEIFEDDKTVLLPSGNVVLDGRKAVDFIQFKDPAELEIDRISRKQRFVQSFLREMTVSSVYMQDPDVLDKLHGEIETNLDGRSFGNFVAEMAGLDTENMVFQRVLGTVKTVDDQSLLFPHFQGQLVRQTVSQIRETLAKEDVISEEELTIALEILNGTNTTGLARRTRQIFQDFGFDVITIDNASETAVAYTQVIDRRGNITLAEKAAQIIQCKRVFSELKENGNPAVDVTVILGKDFDGRYVKE